eukprot:evm.model.NODE_16051_length_12503_cov_36.466129.6
MPGRRLAAAATFLALSAASLVSAFQFQASPFSVSTTAPSKRDAVVMNSYQEQLARAKAEKAARQGGQGMAPQQQYMAPPEAYHPPSPPPPPPAQYQQQARQASALPRETNEAVATLLSLLGERLGSGQPLVPEKVRVFTQAAEAVIREARGGGVSAAPVQQYQPLQPSQQTQQYASPPPQQYQQAQYQRPGPQSSVGFEAKGFDYQDEEDAWELGSRTLSGPAPGFKAASAYQPTVTGGFDEDFDDFEKYGLPQPVTRQKKSPFMETLKGTPFYVDIAAQPVSSDEYLKIIQNRVKEAQMKRRREEKHVGIESANFYMEELNRQKRERLRAQAEEQSQQWQQGGQQGQR